MAFNNTVLTDVVDLQPGEVIKSAPHNVSVYETFEDGLVAGRFAKNESGAAHNLDGSATPDLIGVPRRKVSGEIATAGVYSTSGQAIDQVAEVADFGFVTVEVTAAADPAKRDPVYTINAAGADAGKCTEASGAIGALAVTGAVFWEPKGANTWLIRLGQFV